MVEIKFCGMTRGEDVAFAAGLGAAYVGAIFAGGPRHQTVDGAQRVFGAAVPPPLRVAVVAEQTPIEIAGMVNALRLGVVQLHANPSVQRIDDVRAHTSAKIWAVLQIPGDVLPANAADVAAAADGIVLDARVPGGLGGSGVTLPWSQLSRSLGPIRGKCRIVLAGEHASYIPAWQEVSSRRTSRMRSRHSSRTPWMYHRESSRLPASRITAGCARFSTRSPALE